MSWEGYSEFLCKAGHYFCGSADWNIYNEDAEMPCPHCKEPAVFENIVDETNGPPQGHLNLPALLLENEESKQCDMGHYHVVKPAVYRIPSRDEKQKYRVHYPED